MIISTDAEKKLLLKFSDPWFKKKHTHNRLRIETSQPYKGHPQKTTPNGNNLMLFS